MNNKIDQSSGTPSAQDLALSGFSTANAYRALWIFGFFALFPNWIGISVGVRNIRQTLQQSPGLIFTILFFSLIIFLMRIVCSAGLMHAVNRFSNGEKQRFATIFKSGLQHYGGMFLLHVLYFVVFMALSAVLAALTLLIGKVTGITGGCAMAGIALIISTVAILLWVGVGIAFSFSQRYMILDDVPLIRAFSAGFKLFRQHLGFSYKLGLIQVLITMLATLVLAIAFGILGNMPVIGSLVMFILFVFFNGIFGAGFHAMYTKAFLKLTWPEEKKEPEVKQTMETGDKE